MIETQGQLIDRLGGNVAVAGMLKVQHNTVSGWRTRGFPAWASAQLRKIAADENIATSDEIFQVSRPQQRAPAASSEAA